MRRFSSPSGQVNRFFPLFFVLLTALSNAGCSQRAVDRPDAESVPLRAEAEILARAGHYAAQERLTVDYYRIYRKLAYPLPVTAVDNPPLKAEGSFSYPWEIWMIWELEQRINSLGWAAEFSGDQRYRELAGRDLEALAGWEKFNVQRNPHLSVGHAARILTAALDNWAWLPAELQDHIKAACGRLVDNHAAWLQDGRLQMQSTEAVLEHGVLHNIPVIATLGMGMAARAANHPLRDELELHCQALVLAELEYRARGETEALSYDGYVLDFVADWLAGAPESARGKVLSHPTLGEIMSQAAWLALPGELWNFAPFNDVEPGEMQFHAGAQAKLLQWRNDPLSVWYLERFPMERLRSDALAELKALKWPPVEPQAPAPGAREALYAVVLRSGWETGDLAVAISASEATPGHIQKDNGALVIGSGGQWLIDDPGYQQYLSGLEREFTLGPNAHNYPVINGLTQIKSEVTRLACEETNDSLLHAAFDLTEGYGPQSGLERVTRDVWLRGNHLVVVADRVSGKTVKDVQYTWHGHPRAAWWLEGNAWLIHAGGAGLWLQCPGENMDGPELVRLPGTRGQVSIVKKLERNGDSTLWWVFNTGRTPVECEILQAGERLRVKGDGFAQEFSMD